MCVSGFKSGLNCGIISLDAIVAQLVEQLIRNEQVTGSIPANGSKLGLFVDGPVRGRFACSRFLVMLMVIYGIWLTKGQINLLLYLMA